MPIRSAQGGEILIRRCTLIRRRVDIGQVEATREPVDEHARSAAIEVGKGMDTEQASFGEGEQFQQEVARFVRQCLDARSKIEHVVAHDLRNEMGQGRAVLADNDFLTTPAAGESWCQFTADALMQFEKETLVELVAQLALPDCVLSLFDAARQVRRQFDVAQDAERGVDVAGCCVRRLSSASSIA